MPVVPTLPGLTSPPTNAWGLYQYLAQRLPGYDPSEYLRELNSAYIHVWEEVSKLKNQYFTRLAISTVVTPQQQYDLMFNADNALSQAISNRLYQITRIRFLPPSGGLWQASKVLSPQEPDFLSISANPATPPTVSGPYYWCPTGRGSIYNVLPLAASTQIEVLYTFWPLALTWLYGGTISSVGSAVTGVGTNFTQLVQPDFTSQLPASGTVDAENLQAELIVYGNNNASQIYRVAQITDDTHLTTVTPISPALSAGSPYVLAVLPEIPREHIRVIASTAMAKMYSVDGDDARIAEWTAIAANNMQMMKDSLIERQGQDPPTRKRFPYGIARRNRTFLR